MSTQDYAEEWLQFEEELGERPSLAGPAYNGVMIELGKRWQPVDLSVETRDEGVDENVAVRVYTPTRSLHSKLPVVVFFHGGGYAFGDLDSEDPQCKYVASSTPCIVVSVQYRLSPMYKLPIPIDDCCTGFQWVRSRYSIPERKAQLTRTRRAKTQKEWAVTHQRCLY